MIAFVSWFGTLTSIFGSSWLWVAYQKRDKALGVLNGTFFVANVIGLINFF
jgi:hypothetical protein